MPYRNENTSIVQNFLYHVYARGLNKTDIFIEERDYIFFLYLLKRYLTPNFKEKKFTHGSIIHISTDSVCGQVRIEAYCLMKNHFHLLVYNLKEKGLSKLMLRVLTSYSKYFNFKYKREGSLFQGSYRSVPIRSEEQLNVTGVYIHLNPVKAKIVNKAREYKYSSLLNYIENKGNKWLKLNIDLQKNIDFLRLEEYEQTLENVENLDKKSYGIDL